MNNLWVQGFQVVASLKVKVELLVPQFCPTIHDPMNSSLPGSYVHGILQAKILEWGGSSLLQGIFPTQGSNLYHALQADYLLSEPNHI